MRGQGQAGTIQKRSTRQLELIDNNPLISPPQKTRWIKLPLPLKGQISIQKVPDYIKDELTFPFATPGPVFRFDPFDEMILNEWDNLVLPIKNNKFVAVVYAQMQFHASGKTPEEALDKALNYAVQQGQINQHQLLQVDLEKHSQEVLAEMKKEGKRPKRKLVKDERGPSPMLPKQHGWIATPVTDDCEHDWEESGNYYEYVDITYHNISFHDPFIINDPSTARGDDFRICPQFFKKKNNKESYFIVETFEDGDGIYSVGPDQKKLHGAFADLEVAKKIKAEYENLRFSDSSFEIEAMQVK